MHPTFLAVTERLSASFDRLMACVPHVGATRLPINLPTSGVYLFSEGGAHLYVGRTDRLRDRHREHWSGRENDAPFAFKLARIATNNVGKGGSTRSELMADPAFQAAFRTAREKIATMQFRWVEEKDPNRQCLLEIYVAIVLGAAHNDFRNH